MSSWLDPHTDPVDWGDVRNFLLSFPLFTPFQIHSWAVQATGYGPEKGWFPSDATAEEQIMYGLYWVDLGIIGWAVSGEYVSVGSAFGAALDIAAPAAPYVGAAAIVLGANRMRGDALDPGSPVSIERHQEAGVEISLFGYWLMGLFK